jgi:hypothetical protein
MFVDIVLQNGVNVDISDVYETGIVLSYSVVSMRVVTLSPYPHTLCANSWHAYTICPKRYGKVHPCTGTEALYRAYGP